MCSAWKHAFVSYLNNSTMKSLWAEEEMVPGRAERANQSLYNLSRVKENLYFLYGQTSQKFYLKSVPSGSRCSFTSEQLFAFRHQSEDGTSAARSGKCVCLSKIRCLLSNLTCQSVYRHLQYFTHKTEGLTSWHPELCFKLHYVFLLYREYSSLMDVFCICGKFCLFPTSFSVFIA